MHLTHSRIRNFRCLNEVDLDFDGHLNLIVGDNGSGKSSLLEALYFLGRARSFRAGSPDQCVQQSRPGFSVFGRISTPGGQITAGISRRAGETRLQVNGDSQAKVLELVRTLPIQLVDPGIHRLTEEGPEQRRRFMDWGVFHVEHVFYPAWQRYRRALKQRNKALKHPDGARLAAAWDEELASSGEQLDACRSAHMQQLADLLPELCRQVLGSVPVSLRYHRGWDSATALQQITQSNLEGDLEAGFTRAGPHRADIRLGYAQASVKTRASRGEQKGVTILLSLAQAILVGQETGTSPILLIDDLAAELGERIRDQVAEAVQAMDIQCFITFLDRQLISPAFGRGQMFHVEQGGVSPVV